MFIKPLLSPVSITRENRGYNEIIQDVLWYDMRPICKTLITKSLEEKIEYLSTLNRQWFCRKQNILAIQEKK